VVEINEGEVVCNKCKGSGELVPDLYTPYPRECDKCFGCGKLDWIEVVIGKQKLTDPSHVHSSWRPSSSLGILVNG